MIYKRPIPPRRSTRIPKHVERQCAWTLGHVLKLARPDLAIDPRGYVEKPEDNLLPGIRLGDFESDLKAGAGNELHSKFLAAHSSSALAVNCFAPFRNAIFPLSIGFQKHLKFIGFEKAFPTGLAGTPPHLDFVADVLDFVAEVGPSGLFAVESKCLEYLRPPKLDFSESYELEIKDKRASGPWFAEMLRLMKPNEQKYRFLDVAQLIKHALGVANRHHNATLIYLYWEPLDECVSPIFAEHRSEIASFAARVAGGTPCFKAMSYSELWQAWARAFSE